MTWNVVWQVDPNNLLSCIERDWFHDIMSAVPIHSVHVDHDAKPLLATILSHPIVCASCPNQTSCSDLIGYMKRLPKPRVLYHMSDEFIQVGLDVYEHCELVIRNGSANFETAGNPTVIQLPLGYATGFGNSTRVFTRSSQRTCSFTFLGAMKHERATTMLPALQGIKGLNFVRWTASFEAATKHFDESTIAIYKNAVFVPNPKGNWNPECNRLYDALEWGCIPLIKRYPDSAYHHDYHDRLLGPHPLPTFDDWREAADFADRLLSEKTALDARQAEIAGWWQGLKAGLRARVAAKLADLA
jgi:hypothetical protein